LALRVRFYAQIDVLGQTKRIPLPTADSIAKALSARQDLKNKIAAGDYPPTKIAQEAQEVAQSAKLADHTCVTTQQKVLPVEQCRIPVHARIRVSGP